VSIGWHGVRNAWPSCLFPSGGLPHPGRMTTLIMIDQPCQRCGHDRVVRLGWSNDVFCFNCRGYAGRSTRADDGDPPLADLFTPAELMRLRIYRVAIRDGFFSDA
jgi:hypothetical protein